MRILLVKTSSLGDVIHNLPVVSDIHQHLPGVHIDWCVEESFADIPRLHAAVDRVIPVALRRWRKHLSSPATWREIGKFRQALQAHPYDWIIDTQGLIKSALLCRIAHGKKAGYHRDVVREPLAARIYDATFFVPRTLHAIERNRRLAAAVLGYTVNPALDYGIQPPTVDVHAWVPPPLPYVVLLTATSRDDKLWPEACWIELGQQLQRAGLCAVLPSGTAREQDRAERIARAIPHAVATPRLNLPALAGLLGHARAVVGVDTGLTHLAAALGKTTLALYTATDPGLTGVLGSGRFRNLGGQGQIPPVDEVWQTGCALDAWPQTGSPAP